MTCWPDIPLTLAEVEDLLSVLFLVVVAVIGLLGKWAQNRNEQKQREAARKSSDQAARERQKQRRQQYHHGVPDAQPTQQPRQSPPTRPDSASTMGQGGSTTLEEIRRRAIEYRKRQQAQAQAQRPAPPQPARPPRPAGQTPTPAQAPYARQAPTPPAPSRPATRKAKPAPRPMPAPPAEEAYVPLGERLAEESLRRQQERKDLSISLSETVHVLGEAGSADGQAGTITAPGVGPIDLDDVNQARMAVLFHEVLSPPVALRSEEATWEA